MSRSILRLLLAGLAFLLPLLLGAAGPGRVVSWGAGGPGSSGHPNYGQATNPAAVSDGVIAIAAGPHFSVALKDNGTVVAWGANNDPSFITVPSGLGGVTAIASSSNAGHILALRNNGTLVAWGCNSGGQVTGTPTPGAATADPVTLGGQVLAGVVGMAAGDHHSLAVKSDGTVVAWGYNLFGETAVPSGLGDVVAVAAGYHHSLALKADGTVVAWGDNSDGQTNVPAGLSGVVAISASTFCSLALKSDGTVVAWGDSFSFITIIPPGLSDVVAISAGGEHALALKNDGTIVAWGGNAEGEVTIPPAAQGCVLAIAAGGYHSLALVTAQPTVATLPASQVRLAGQAAIFTAALSGSPPAACQWYKDGVALTDDSRISGAATASLTVSGLTAADAGHYTVEVGNCAGTALSDPAVLTVLPAAPPGRVLAWGDDTFGQSTVPTAANSGVVAVSAGQGHTLALKAGGQLLAWGWNGSGQTAVPFSTLNGSVAIAAGQAHSLALRNDGIVFAWGNNAEGQANVPAGLSGIVAIAAGGAHSVALKNDGTVVAWGHNGFGQSSVPPGLATVTALAAGMYHTLALKADGTVAAWGDNSQGQCAVPAGLSGVVAIAAGFSHSAAVKADGTVIAWGDDSHGQATVPAGLSDMLAGAAGRFHTVALKNNRTLAAWGDDSAGQSTVPATVQGRALAVTAGWLHTVAIAGSAPLILDGPLSAYVNLGRDVHFTVLVEGTPPLACQWRRQSAMGTTDIPGATSPTLSLTGVQASQAGQYTLVVTNAEGSVTSSPAQLTVLAATTFAQWQESRFSAADLANPAVSGPLADPLGEGLPNLLRYALEPEASAGGPSAPGGATPGWPLVPTLSDADGKLTLVFQALRTDVTYTVEASTDLVTWSAASVTLENNGTLHTARFAPPAGARAFLRVVVTKL